MKTKKNGERISSTKEAKSSPAVISADEQKQSAAKEKSAQISMGKSYFEVIQEVGAGCQGVADGSNKDCGHTKLSEQQQRLIRVQGVAIDLLLKAYNSMIELAAVRIECKLSNTRVSGVARELKELIKVMTVYDCL